MWKPYCFLNRQRNEKLPRINRSSPYLEENLRLSRRSKSQFSEKSSKKRVLEPLFKKSRYDSLRFKIYPVIMII